jgi:hypothetical protein
MRVRIREVGPGLHPSEAVVEIQTVERPEKLVVDRKSIQDQSISAGLRPLGQRNGSGQWLIELPRETMSGTWRVWVHSAELVSDGVMTV